MREYNTLPQMLFSQVAKYGDRDALLYKVGEEYIPISWNAFATMVREVGAGLISLGVKEGDRVGLMSYNRPEWVVADFAIMSIGAITVPIYHTSTTARTNFILDKTKADVAFVARSEKAEMLATCEAPIQRIISLDPKGADSPGSCGYDYPQLRELGATGLQADLGKELEKRLQKIKTDDCATIIFTSGTTGEPKGVMLSHKNLLENAAAGLAAVQVGPDDVFLSFLPLSHSFERTVGEYLMLMAGATVAYAASLRSVADNINEVHPTIMLGVPRFYEKLYSRVMEKINAAPAIRQKIFHWGMKVGRQCRLLAMEGENPPAKLRFSRFLAEHLVFAKLKKRLGGRLRFFVSGGAPLAQEIGEFFLNAGVDILEGYGLTEFSPVISVNRIGRIRPGTVGLPFPGVEVKIAEDGELLVRGPSVMLGYYQDEEATKEAIKDGWLYTGDKAVLEDGYIRIVDRKKDIIVTSGGKNIPPQLIEGLVATDEFIAQIMLYGDRKKFISALVVPDYERLATELPKLGLDENATPEELAGNKKIYGLLMKRIEERTKDLPAYEHVKKIFILPEQFTEERGELTPTMKVKRKEVTRKYQKELDALYE
jgi:long-chain acyl-CoA synthetase